jgi:HEPN domain-containing protein
MEQRTSEWLEQSDYDMDTAVYMYEGARYIYAVFMCHLSIEKALKGFFYEKHRSIPPKSHNFNKAVVKDILDGGRDVVSWIKRQL